MGVKEKIKKFVGGNDRTENACTQNPQTSEIHCERRRVFKDGTKQLLAVEDWTITAPPECKGVAIRMDEFEEGELKKLDNYSVPKMKSKCKSEEKPSDY